MSRDVREKPFTLKQRKRLCFQSGRMGDRERVDWCSGNLPAPYAEGDLLWLPEGADVARDRLKSDDHGYFVVSAGFSIDYGDAWYFRVTNGTGNSDRMHVAYPGRCSWKPEDCVDFMAPFELVDTADPEGLAIRERLLADGWTYEENRCPHCGRAL